MDDKTTLGWREVDCDEELLAELWASLKRSVTSAWAWYEHMRLAEAAFRCLWLNKSPDGRKPEQDENGDRMRPWPGASDAEVRQVMERVLEHRDVCFTAGQLARWDLVAGVGPEDMETAKRVKSLLKWWHGSQMPEAWSQEKLWCLWGTLYGVSVLGLDWRKRHRLVPVTWTAEEVLAALVPQAAQMAQEAQLPIAQLLLEHGDLHELAEARAVEETLSRGAPTDAARLLRESWPQLTTKTAKLAVESMRTSGKARLPEKVLKEDRPEWQALVAMDDVFFPTNLPTGGVQDSPWIARRRWMTLEELKGRANDPDPAARWDEEWVDRVLELDGQAGSSLTPHVAQWRLDLELVEGDQTRRDGINRGDADRWEIIEMYYRATDEMGCHGLYKAVFCPALAAEKPDEDGSDLMEAGWHGLSDAAEYPFVEFVYEETSKTLLGNHGVGTMVRDLQRQAKERHDQDTDAADLARNPPRIRALRDRDALDNFQPGGTLVEGMTGTTKLAQVVLAGANESLNLKRGLERSASRLTGIEDMELPPTLAARRQAMGAASWLKARARALMGTLELAKNCAEKITVLRVTGDLSGPFSMKREELAQSEYDLTFVWDPRSLDMKQAAELMAMTREIASGDVEGVLNKTMMMMDMLSLVSPYATDRWLLDTQAASGREAAEEQGMLSQVLSGIEAPLLADKGWNVPLRMQIMGALEQTPGVQETLQTKPAAAALWEKRKKHFQFVMDQRENARIGRSLGVKPETTMTQT